MVKTRKRAGIAAGAVLAAGLAAGLTAGLTVGLAADAQAASLSLQGSGGTTAYLGTAPGAGASPAYDPVGVGGTVDATAAPGQAITVYNGTTGGSIDGGLWLDGAATLTYTFLGKEAGATDNFVTPGGSLSNQTSAPGTSVSVVQSAAGYLDFFYNTVWRGPNNPNSPDKLFAAGETDKITNGGTSEYAGFGIGFLKLSDTSYLAFFDDGRNAYVDYDDFVVKIEVAAVPLPAGAALLVTALGGLAVARRLRRTA